MAQIESSNIICQQRRKLPQGRNRRQEGPRFRPSLSSAIAIPLLFPASTTWPSSTTPGPLRRGGAAVRTGRCNSARGAGRAPSRHHHQPQQPGQPVRPQGRYAEAEPLLRRRCSSGERCWASAIPTPSRSLNNLASLYDAQGRYAEAEPLYSAGLAISTRGAGRATTPTMPPASTTWPCSTATGPLRRGRAALHAGAGAPREGAGRATTPTRHQPQQPGLLYDDQGRYAEAEPLLPAGAGNLQARCWASDHPDVATSLNNLAALYDDQGRYAEAEPLYAQALAAPAQGAGRATTPTSSPSLNNLACLRRTRVATPRPSRSTPGAATPARGAGRAPSRHHHQPQQPGQRLRPRGPLRRGRAALRPSPRAQPRRAGAGSSSDHCDRKPGRCVDASGPGHLRLWSSCAGWHHNACRD